MKKHEKVKMILRQLNGEASKKENEVFSQWLLEESDNLDLYIEIKETWEMKSTSFLQFDSAKAWNKISQVADNRPPKFRLWPKWVSIAAVALIFVTVGTIIFVRENINSFSLFSVNSDLITKSSKAGEQLSVTLSDGSIVRLNAESSIQFPDKFEKNCRKITLSGEAFFEVMKDSSRPFIIQTNNVKTTVLGTSFNIRAFDNNKVLVTVATGRVKVETVAGMGKDQVFLHPNEQGIYNSKNSTIEIEEVDAKDYYDWTEGFIRFNNDSLEEVARMLERWYNVPIRLHGNIHLKSRIKGSFKGKKLETVLDGLCFIYNLEYHINNNKEIVITTNLE